MDPRGRPAKPRGSAPGDDGPRRLQSLCGQTRYKPGQLDAGSPTEGPQVLSFSSSGGHHPALGPQAQPLRCSSRLPLPRAPPAVVVARRELPPPRPGEAGPGAAATASRGGVTRAVPAPARRQRSPGGAAVGVAAPAGLTPASWPRVRPERLPGVGEDEEGRPPPSPHGHSPAKGGVRHVGPRATQNGPTAVTLR